MAYLVTAYVLLIGVLISYFLYLIRRQNNLGREIETWRRKSEEKTQ